MNQNPIPIELNDVQKKRRGRPPKTDLLKNGNGLSIHRTVVPIAPYPTPGLKFQHFIPPGCNNKEPNKKVLKKNVQVPKQQKKKQTRVKELKLKLPTRTCLKEKNDHKAEEQRRKARINLWISKLGAILFGSDSEKQTKRIILERAYNYISDKEQTSKKSITSIPAKMVKLNARIKDLETSIVLLINILKRNNIKLPDEFDEPLLSGLDINKSPTFSGQTLLSGIKCTQQEAEQLPLHIHLVLPPLSQVNSSTILTLTATAPKMSSCVSTMSTINNEVAPPVIMPTRTKPLDNQKKAGETNTIDQSNVDFCKSPSSGNEEPSSSRSSNTSIITEGVSHTISSTSKASASISVTNGINKTNTVTTMLPSKSVTQVFGIDNILIQEINSTNSLRNQSSSTTTAVTTTTNFISSVISIDQVCDKADVSSSRQRLPSSGHTVAALLDSRMSTKSNESTTSSSENNNGIPDSKETTKSNSILNIEPKQVAANSNLTSKARWGNLLESAHSKYHLSSFTLSSNKKQGNKRNHQKTIKEAKSQSFKQISKQLPTSSRLSGKTVESPKTTLTVSNVATQSQLANSHDSSLDLTVPPAMLLNSVTDGENQVQNNQPDIAMQHPNLPSKKLSENAANQIKTSQPNLAKPVSNVQNKLSEANLNTFSLSLITSSVETYKQRYTSTDVRDKQGIKTKHALTNISKQPEKYSGVTEKLDIVRTMKDRSIRNKWLISSVNTLSKATSPTLRIATSECTVEECASPVISYPNVGKRKRKLLFNSTSEQVNDHPIINLSKEQSNGKNIAGSSQNFTAESLCRSSNVNYKGKRITKGDSKESDLKKAKQDETQKTARCSDVKKTQLLSNNSSSLPANTLPTILNIFAPAPVPTTPQQQQQQQHQQQQQTFQSAFSNFSVETLAGTENMSVMETGAGNFSVNNFSENILMAGNSQMFSNFSANSLVSENEHMANMMGQPSNPSWNNTNSNWMAQDMNDAFFQNMTNVRQPRQQQMLQVSTECSPIKSIMSILNSTSNNQQPNFQFDPQDSQNAALPNFFSNNQQLQQQQPLQHQQEQSHNKHQQQQQQQQQQPLQQQQSHSKQQQQQQQQQQPLQQQQNHNQQQQQQQIIQMRNMRNNLTYNPSGNDCIDYMMNPWLSTNKVNGNVTRNPNALNLPTTANWPNFHAMHNQGYRVMGKDGNASYNFMQTADGGNPNNIPAMNNQNVKTAGMKTRVGSDASGPMFGNISLVNSISQS